MSQLETNPTQVTERESHPRADGRSMRWFFVCMASVLIIIVAVGFAPSFYLPSVIRPEQLAAGKYDNPSYIVAHGILLSLWFLLFFTQAFLIATKREHIHRRLGIAGVAVAAALVPLTLVVITRSVARSNLSALAVIGDYGVLALFAGMVTVAIWNRRKPDVHKRLLLIASISLTAPAIVRWPGAEAAVPLSVVVPQLTLFAVLIVHDIVTRRRVHQATVWGVAAYVLVLGLCVPLGMSDFGQQLVKSLK